MTALFLVRPAALAAAAYPPYTLCGTPLPATVFHPLAPRLLADLAPRGSGGARHPAML